MSESKTELSATSAVVTRSPAKQILKTRVDAHLKKWWWIHVIIIICVALVIILPVIFVGYPRIAQDQVTESTLNITHMEISSPSPDSFHLFQTQVIGSKSSFHPVIYSFAAAVSLAGGSPFGSVAVPQVKAEDGASLRVDQDVRLGDKAAFGDFAKAALLNETFALNVYGRPKLRQGALQKVGVVYDKTVRIKGLNKLDGFNITELKISPADEPDGTNARGMVYIPNPSIMTIALGNVTMDLSVNNTRIGQSFLNDLTLRPRNNTVPMTAKVDKLAVVNMLPGDGILPVQITGNSSFFDGRELSYFSEALQDNTLHTKLDVTKAFL